MKFARAWACGVIAGLLYCVAAHAAWPQERPITLIVPFPPGGTTDMVGRTLASALGKQLHQTVIVDNRGGAGGTLGAAHAARAQPDGYTLFLATAAHTVAPSIYDALSYDFIKDFVPITMVASCPHVLIVNNKLPVDSVEGLIEYAKAHPGQVNYGSAGVGSTDHLAVELFARSAGIALEHVPYKGDAPMMTDLLAGQIQMAIPPSAVVMGPAQTHGVKALAVTSPKPSAYFPGLPAMARAPGLSGYSFETWYALMAPAGTPADVQAKLYQSVLAALKTSDMQRALQTLSAEPGGMPPKDLGRLIEAETQKWRVMLKPVK